MAKKLSNKKNGNDFEIEFVERLAFHGFWAHRFAQNTEGQPCDVICARNNNTFLFDCKVCEKDRFDSERIEANQLLAMQLFERRGNNQGLFALKLSNNDVFILTLKDILNTKTSTLNAEQIMTIGVPAERWFSKVCT